MMTLHQDRVKNPFVLFTLVAALAGCQGPPGSPPSLGWSDLAGATTRAELNVVLITIDTLRADRLSSYGSRLVATPHIDALATEGVRFANAATTVPFTLPAHSSIMTGTYPPTHGVRENVGYALAEGLPTLSEQLGAAGWDTAGFVSAFVLDSRWGIGRGFDHYRDEFVIQGRQVNMGAVQRDGADTVAAALEWLDRPRDRPFFLWVHLFDPHDPYEPPEPYRSQYPDHPYEAEVAYTDSLIGELRDGLVERGLLDASLLVLTSDHGEGLGQHGEGYHGYFIYDSTVHVPLIVRLPFGEVAGTVVEEAVSHVDIAPTVLAALGQAVPDTFQGEDLLPAILGEQDADARLALKRQVYTESYYSLYHYNWEPLRAVRTRDHKFIETTDPELYRLGEDAGETRNLVRRERDAARDLRQALLDYASSIEGSVTSAQPDLDEETLRQLRALGYVAGRGGHDVSVADGPRPDPKDKIAVHRALMTAQSLIGGGREEEAQRQLEAALELDPGMVDAYQMLGNITAQRAEPKVALSHFQAALERNQEHRPSLYGLANSYRELGRLDEALVGFRRLQTLSPHDSKAVIAMTEILVDQGRRAEALGVVEEAGEHEDAPALLHNQHGELLVLEGRAGEAGGYFERAIDLNPRLAQPRYNLAVLYEEQGRSEDAIESYRQAVRRAPAHYQAQFNLGRLYGAAGDTDAQAVHWTMALQGNPEFTLGYFLLAKLLMDAGEDLTEAEKLAREGLRLDPTGGDRGFGRFVLADILNRQGRGREAAEQVRRGRRNRG